MKAHDESFLGARVKDTIITRHCVRARVCGGGQWAHICFSNQKSFKTGYRIHEVLWNSIPLWDVIKYHTYDML